LETSFWDVIWWLLIVFAWTLVLWMFIAVFADIFRRRDMSGWGKAGWIVLIFALPFVGALVYVIFRPKHLEGDVELMAAAAGPYASPADELAKAQQLQQSGAITQEEFQALKNRILG
jgi:hypothetical protein